MNQQKKYLTILAMLFSLFGFCQCKYNRFYSESLLPQNAVYYFLGDTTETPRNDIKKIAAYTDPLFEKAKKDIIARSGEQFYQNLKIRSLLVTYPGMETVDPKDERIYDLSSQDVTYEIEYLYYNSTFDYIFTVDFNNDGDVFHDLEIPDISKNKDFEKLTDVCAAIKTVKALPKFATKKVDTVRLRYNSETENFCWAITEKCKEYTTPGEHECTVNEYYVNANTDKLEKTAKTTSYIIVTEPAPVKKKKRRK